jgi:hypothetical protein
MSFEPRLRFKHFIRRSVIGYFAPVIAARKLWRKRSWNYARQFRVVYRYAFWQTWTGAAGAKIKRS